LAQSVSDVQENPYGCRHTFALFKKKHRVFKIESFF